MTAAKRKNVVLLTTDSRDSLSKAKHYSATLQSMGIGVREYPDRHTIGVFACSDARAIDAAWLAQLHGILGPDPLAVEIARNKSLAYQFLSRENFDMLFWHIPKDERDFAASFDQPVIVKPERGSGSYGLHPWAYRSFESPMHFRRYLVRSKLMGDFLKNQEDPHSWSGRYVMMEYIQASAIHAMSAVLSDDAVVPFDVSESTLMSGTMQVESMLIGKRHRDIGRIMRMMKAFLGIGFRRSVMYIQCVEKKGKLYPIDINLRPGTMCDRLALALELPLYEKLLGFMLGQQRDFKQAWPAPYIGINRIDTALDKGEYRVEFGPEAVPLISKVSYSKKRPYDIGHAWPMFAVLGQSPGECRRKAKAVRNACKLTRISRE
jgi:hypothetical protein